MTLNMATLVGFSLFVGYIGGAVGPWLAGKIFDLTSNYQWAFIVGSIVGLAAVASAWMLKRHTSTT